VLYREVVDEGADAEPVDESGTGSPHADRVLAGVVLVLGLVVALVLGLLTSTNVERRRDQQFASRVEATRAAVSRRVDAYTEVLFGLRAVLASSPVVTREGFASTVRQLDLSRRLPGAAGLSWAPLVDGPEDAAAFAARNPGLGAHPELAIRTEHLPVEMIEPVAGNEMVLGYDVASEPVRRQALDAARDGGDPVATGPVELVQGGRGFLVFLAVYDGTEIPVTAPARRRHFRGVVAAVFQLERMLKQVLGGDRPVELEIHDVGLSVNTPSAISQRSLLFDSTGSGWALSSRGAPTPRLTTDLNVADRRWRLFAFAGPAFPHRTDALLPWGVGLGVAMLGAAVAGLVLALSRSRRLAMALAREMTASLRARESDLQRANEELVAVNAELMGVNATMREFVAVASHELRTPLATIIGSTDVLANTLEAADDQTLRLVDIVSRQSGVLSRLVTDLLTVSRIDAGTMTTSPQSVQVVGAVGDVLRDLDLRDVAVSCDERLGAWCDPDHLRRMLTNYLTNARRYGEPPFSVEVTATDGWIDIKVVDRGPGVDHDVVDRLFGRFARSAQGPTGLGLSIVKGLAEANGGSACYSAGAGGGSVFGIRVPSQPPSNRG
jgi:signal transduction histidine kinase